MAMAVSIPLSPGAFRILNLSFMEGRAYVAANLRGGGEYGDKWHDVQAQSFRKQMYLMTSSQPLSTLIKNSYIHKRPSSMAWGLERRVAGSARQITQRPGPSSRPPGSGVPDMLRYHKFTAGAGWAHDYGTADDQQRAQYP